PDFSAAFAAGNLDAVRLSTQRSLLWLSRPSSQSAYPYLDITHDRAVASLEAFLDLLNTQGIGAMSSAQLNALVADRFEVYESLGAFDPDDHEYTGNVLFTGYYTPTYDASPVQTPQFCWPLYKRPADLVTDPTGQTASRRMADGSTGPYPARKEIESGLLAGQELVWLGSRWEAYVITVQGSARLRMPDGHIMEVGYAGSNGRDYTSPGRLMVADGAIPADQLNFATMRAYFQAHPEMMDKYLWANERDTFFTEVHGGPFGALNIPVTPMATIATDKSVYPAGMLAFIPGYLQPPPGNLAQGLFVLDQDRGGAIRSAGRCDIYMGIGDTAEATSGQTLKIGQLYYLAVKPELVSKYLPATRPGGK
ncbi:MAG TPA: MltA domain-containing protein, partial [Tepidisphaeraceae bacterium]|nr:MltA domain-containing protein [Tepidisphaeraceae bacterium]